MNKVLIFQSTNRWINIQKLEDSWREVSAGHFHGCGIKTDGKAYCWGNNRNGRMGTGGVSEPQDYVLSPQPVQSNGNWVSISAKGSHTCGLQDDDSAWCWGGNEVSRVKLQRSWKKWTFDPSVMRSMIGIDFDICSVYVKQVWQSQEDWPPFDPLFDYTFSLSEFWHIIVSRMVRLEMESQGTTSMSKHHTKYLGNGNLFRVD